MIRFLTHLLLNNYFSLTRKVVISKLWVGFLKKEVLGFDFQIKPVNRLGFSKMQSMMPKILKKVGTYLIQQQQQFEQSQKESRWSILWRFSSFFGAKKIKIFFRNNSQEPWLLVVLAKAGNCPPESSRSWCFQRFTAL